MTISRRAQAAVSVLVAAARIRIAPPVVLMWTEVGVGPLPDDRGVYRRHVVTA